MKLNTPQYNSLAFIIIYLLPLGLFFFRGWMGAGYYLGLTIMNLEQLILKNKEKWHKE
jgi:hypothetical protein